MSYLALAKQVEAGLRRQRQERVPPSSSSPTPHDAGLDPALLEKEEALFRLWWGTLPNKTTAREDWEAEFAYYAAKRASRSHFSTPSRQG